MRYKIFENGVEINVIVADAAFVESYCEKRGYTYALSELPDSTESVPAEEVTWEAMADAIAEGVNEV